MHEDGMQTRWMDLLLEGGRQLERLRWALPPRACDLRRDTSIHPLMTGNGREGIDGGNVRVGGKELPCVHGDVHGDSAKEVVDNDEGGSGR